jgi:hypothetical protein
VLPFSRQDSASVSTPPAVSPTLVPMPASAPWAAIARVRCGPSGKLADSAPDGPVAEKPRSAWIRGSTTRVYLAADSGQARVRAG